MPIVRHAGGGRPRLYCSDAHRTEARRRRLGGRHAVLATRTGDIGQVRQLLADALARLDECETAVPAFRDDAIAAAVRAESTAALLRAQQVAAEAARRAAAAEERVASERAQWQARMKELEAARSVLDASVQEQEGALDGARAELQAEILRHHRDVEALAAEHHAREGAEQAARSELEETLAALRTEMEAARASAAGHQRRIEALEAALEDAAVEIAALHVRAARAEEEARLRTREIGRLQRVRAKPPATPARTSGRRSGRTSGRPEPTTRRGPGAPARRAGGPLKP